MKKSITLLLIISLSFILTGCIFQNYELNMEYENKIITDSVNPFDSELVNGLCSYDLSDNKVTLGNEANVDSILFEEVGYEFFETTDDLIFRLQLSCDKEKMNFYYIIDEDEDGLLTELFEAQTPNETYQKYSSEMEYLYDLEAIQNYAPAKLSTTFRTITINPDHQRLKFFYDMVGGISYTCDVSDSGMLCSRMVYSASTSNTDPAQEHTYEIITIEIVFGKLVNESQVTYYQYEGCHENATECTKTPIETTTKFLYKEWGGYIDISRDPRGERLDSRDFYQRATYVISKYTLID